MECPNCNGETIVKEGQPTCNYCGAYAEIYPENTTLQWILDGRVIKNDEMARTAWEAWKKFYPEQFEEAEKLGKSPY